jgi:hypothetical protein
MDSEFPEANKLHRFLSRQGAISTCMNCLSWDGEKCLLAKTTPPPEVLVFGCPAWDNTLPF